MRKLKIIGIIVLLCFIKSAIFAQTGMLSAGTYIDKDTKFNGGELMVKQIISLTEKNINDLNSDLIVFYTVDRRSDISKRELEQSNTKDLFNNFYDKLNKNNFYENEATDMLDIEIIDITASESKILAKVNINFCSYYLPQDSSLKPFITDDWTFELIQGQWKLTSFEKFKGFLTNYTN